MAQTITPDPTGDTPKRIEDKVRALPANQGLNETAMWAKIDAEISAAATANKLKSVESYVSSNKHGN